MEDTRYLNLTLTYLNKAAILSIADTALFNLLLFE